MASELSKELEDELLKKYPKIARHPRREEIIRLAENQTAGDRIAAMTYEWSREVGIEPGSTSPYSVSTPTMISFVKWWREKNALTALSVMPVGAQQIVADLAVRTDHNAVTRKRQTLDLLDRVVQKFGQQLESQQGLSIQTALQAMALRDQLESQERQVVVTMDAAVEQVVMELLNIVNSVCTKEQRKEIMQKIEESANLRKLMESSNGQDESAETGDEVDQTAVEAEFTVSED